MNFEEYAEQECPELEISHLPEGISLAELEAEFDNDPLWAKTKDHPDKIRNYALTLQEAKNRLRGEKPEEYDTAVECAKCGPVYLYSGLPEKVIGCPWCANRIKGLPIPRPAEKLATQEESV